MTKVVFALALWLAVLVVPGLCFAQTPGEETLSSEEHWSEETPGGCPVVCSQYEACIEHRCVEMCRTGCRPGTFCTAAGTCQPLPPPKEVILTEADRQRLSGAKSADKRSVLFLDVGGVVGFGVALGFEHGAENSFLARARFLNSGLMSHAVFQENEFQKFDWGVGGSIAARHYEAWSGNMRGFYYGGGFDYSMTRVADRVRTEITQTLHSVAPFGEFGYRWVFGNFAFGFGPTIALRYPIVTGFAASSRLRCDSSGQCEETSGRRFEGTVHIELGWFR